MHTEEIRAHMLRRPGRTAAQAFWISRGEHHLTPSGVEFPEGFDVNAVLRDALGPFQVLLEIGCGDGRLAAMFDPAEYIGVDINPEAIARAKKRLPGHVFSLHDIGLSLAASDVVLFYNVLLHVPDDEIRDRLAEATVGRPRIVIAEMMDRRWRRSGEPPIFNRDPDDYIEIMRGLGYAKTRRMTRVCARYNSSPWTEIASPDFTLLTCEGEQSGSQI